MSETSEQTTVETTDEGTDEVFDKDRALEKIRKLNSENKNLRARTKALEPLEAAAQEAERAKQTTEERFAALLAETTARAERAEQALLRGRVAREAGLPDDLADRLRGDDEESLLADAKALAEKFSVPDPKPARRSDPSQGSDPMPLNGSPLEQALRNAVGAR